MTYSGIHNYDFGHFMEDVLTHNNLSLVRSIHIFSTNMAWIEKKKKEE